MIEQYYCKEKLDAGHSYSLTFKDQETFSLQYQYNIKQTSDKNKEKYKLADY